MEVIVVDNTKNNDFRNSQKDFRDSQDMKSKVLRDTQNSNGNDFRDAQDSREMRDSRNRDLRDNFKNC